MKNATTKTNEQEKELKIDILHQIVIYHGEASGHEIFDYCRGAIDDIAVQLDSLLNNGMIKKVENKKELTFGITDSGKKFHDINKYPWLF